MSNTTGVIRRFPARRTTVLPRFLCAAEPDIGNVARIEDLPRDFVAWLKPQELRGLEEFLRACPLPHCS